MNTPKTDNAEHRQSAENGFCGKCVPASFARQLERELAAMRAHAEKLAAQLAECAGYIASVRTDRTDATNGPDGIVYALQTLEWAEGAIEIAENANAALEAHDAFLANNEGQPRPTESL